eukprot:TRINITY_DN5796_c0_g1_i1.p1 TRINITY_DN5796_c0_g1~~TRINITY_DN5796_c0_g1_i1.p1  ORF type:complete len:709 (-),score=119.69 TRINITY_DN5796_c0_g1_i1:268-2394(-)
MNITDPKKIVIPEELLKEYISREQSVRRWMETILSIKLDPCLHDALKNGVLLCRLMLAIVEHSIPRIQDKTTDKSFKLKENIYFFLQAAMDIGISRDKLFTIKDLWDGSGMVQVIECLWEIANRAKDLGYKITLLPIRNGEIDRALQALSYRERQRVNEQISRRLITMFNNKTNPNQIADRKKVMLVAPNMMRRQIASLGDPEAVERGLIRFQALFRMYKQKKKYHQMVVDAAYREHVAKEILHTERSYVDSLNVCIKVFMNPLDEASRLDKKKAQLITTDQFRTLFSVITIIRNFNAKLLEQLEERLSHWSPNCCIGEIFLKIVDFLKVYTKYCQNFDSAMRLLENLIKLNPKLDDFLYQNSMFNPETKGLDLPQYLIMPVQRIPRYHLLLSDLLRHTWESHPDYNTLVEATMEVASVAETMNQKKREAENVSRTVSVAASINHSPFYLPESHRRFLARASTTDYKQQIFLFSDLVVITKPAQISRVDVDALHRKQAKKNALEVQPSELAGESAPPKYDFVEAIPLTSISFITVATDLPATDVVMVAGENSAGKQLRLTFATAEKKDEFLDAHFLYSTTSASSVPLPPLSPQHSTGEKSAGSSGSFGGIGSPSAAQLMLVSSLSLPSLLTPPPPSSSTESPRRTYTDGKVEGKSVPALPRSVALRGRVVNVTPAQYKGFGVLNPGSDSNAIAKRPLPSSHRILKSPR